MAKRILIPLDRDERSLSVLDLVGGIARASGATVRLLNVAPVPKERVADDGRVVAYASQEMERVELKRLDDLKEAEARLEGAPVESVVRFGDPVEEILREADAFGADLIAVSTERRNWLDRLVGGVANRVFRKADVPVLMLSAR
jgi:nucleotide-binding universal stress UspA family protein